MLIIHFLHMTSSHMLSPLVHPLFELYMHWHSPIVHALKILHNCVTHLYVALSDFPSTATFSNRCFELRAQ